MLETQRRSLLKSLSWRFLATLITGVVAYLLTDEILFAAKIGALDTSVKFIAYFAHERLWLRLPYGRIEPPADYQI